MPDSEKHFVVRLFYSYCHRDAKYREAMEKTLALLRREGMLLEWHDQEVLPGQKIRPEVRQKMKEADILVFLFSQDFFASEECMREWNYAQDLASDHPVFRVPIILEPCGWQKLLTADDVKALPTDGRPVMKFRPQATAWDIIYSEIDRLVARLRETFSPKPAWLKEMDTTDFLSQQRIMLRDTFVFLHLARYPAQTAGNRVLEDVVETPEALLKTQYSLIHGPDESGKTALARFLFLHLVEQSHPVLFVDLKELTRNWARFLRGAYQRQFNGDFAIWEGRPGKTILVDNLSPDAQCIAFLQELRTRFDRIIVMVSSDIYYSYFRDEARLADFCEFRLCPLTHRQQEFLIRRRLKLLDLERPITDGQVDQIENRLNSIIISHRFVPRYPFFVLTILQSYEAFMPNNTHITSYGHCYQTLIVATLIKAGIGGRDADLTTCFNFADHLAYALHQKEEDPSEYPFVFPLFLEEYEADYVLPTSILSRLTDDDYGLIGDDGQFRRRYMYYFFLGRYLARHSDKKEIAARIDSMCEATHLRANRLTVLFTLHHTDDRRIIDNILLHTMCTLDTSPVATLKPIETKRFGSILSELPENVLSSRSVADERGRERDTRDEADGEEHQEDGDTEDDAANGLYRIFKNNEIMGQILRNKHGSLQRGEIAEIIETIADGGLRLVNALLKDDEEIVGLAHYIQKKNPEYDFAKIKRELQFIAFVWTIINVEKIADAIDIPELREIVREVVDARGTPAYDLIGYFSQLDCTPSLTPSIRDDLKALIKRHQQGFLGRVLSIRTQRYMNTHRSGPKLEQAVCSTLKIKYMPRSVRDA